MAGKIIADQIEHSTAGSLDTSYVVNGSAKAWLYSPATSASISDSLNISSITDGGTGEQDMTFTSSMSSADYSSTMATETTNTHNTGASFRMTQIYSKTSALIDARADFLTSSALYTGGHEGAIFYNMS